MRENQGYRALDSGIQLKESRILLTIGIQNPRLSWIPLQEAIN